MSFRLQVNSHSLQFGFSKLANTVDIAVVRKLLLACAQTASTYHDQIFILKWKQLWQKNKNYSTSMYLHLSNLYCVNMLISTFLICFINIMYHHFVSSKIYSTPKLLGVIGFLV